MRSGGAAGGRLVHSFRQTFEQHGHQPSGPHSTAWPQPATHRLDLRWSLDASPGGAAISTRGFMRMRGRWQAPDDDDLTWNSLVRPAVQVRALRRALCKPMCPARGATASICGLP